jgi:DNA-binding transcriptional ArsR family regulator
MNRMAVPKRVPNPEATDETSTAAAPTSAPATATELDRLVHERVRLGMLSALAARDVCSFTDLKALLGATDGNVSVHARKLEDAGYLTCAKTFDGRVPRTEYRITPEGRDALARYLDHMEALIRAARAR